MQMKLLYKDMRIRIKKPYRVTIGVCKRKIKFYDNIKTDVDTQVVLI